MSSPRELSLRGLEPAVPGTSSALTAGRQGAAAPRSGAPAASGPRGGSAHMAAVSGTGTGMGMAGSGTGTGSTWKLRGWECCGLLALPWGSPARLLL